jgi:hypothetical protein
LLFKGEKIMPHPRAVLRLAALAFAICCGAAGTSTALASTAQAPQAAHVTTVSRSATAFPVIVTFRGYDSWSYANAYYESLLSAVTAYEFSNSVYCTPNGPYRPIGFGDPLYNLAAAAAGSLFQVAGEYTCQ